MSSPVPLVLDTNAVLDSGLMHWLAKYHGRKILPSTAYAELAYGFIRKYGNTQRLDRMLRLADVPVDETNMGHARQAAHFAVSRAQGRWDDDDWDKHWRDYLIGAHAALPPHWMVTNNVPDFAFLEDRVISPFDMVEALKHRRPP